MRQATSAGVPQYQTDPQHQECDCGCMAELDKERTDSKHLVYKCGFCRRVVYNKRD